MERWVGKVAVVTGASAGMGSKISVALANAGLLVVGLARHVEPINVYLQNNYYMRAKLTETESVTGHGKIYARRCDVSKHEDVVDTFAWIEQEFGGTDILVNNAGVLMPGHITDAGGNKLSDGSILSIIDINYKGLVMCTRQAVESMKKRNFNGHIININSLAGHYVPFKSQLNVYSSTKHAVTAFSLALLNEFADCNTRIKVTSISPGKVRTNMYVPTADDVSFLEPEDVADCVLFALSTPPHVNIYELGVCAVAEKRI